MRNIPIARQATFFANLREVAAKFAKMPVGTEYFDFGLCSALRTQLRGYGWSTDQAASIYDITDKLKYQLPYWPRNSIGAPYTYIDREGIMTPVRIQLAADLAKMTDEEFLALFKEA